MENSIRSKNVRYCIWTLQNFFLQIHQKYWILFLIKACRYLLHLFIFCFFNFIQYHSFVMNICTQELKKYYIESKLRCIYLCKLKYCFSIRGRGDGSDSRKYFCVYYFIFGKYFRAVYLFIIFFPYFRTGRLIDAEIFLAI